MLLLLPVTLLFWLSLLSCITGTMGFTSISTPSCSSEKEKTQLYGFSNRRDWIQSQFLTTGAWIASATIAAAEEDSLFKPGSTLSVDQAKSRFQLARKDVQYLLDNYSQISKEGGDAVRRYLGTVGTAGYMYGISKVVKLLRDEADDIVEYTEAMDEFNAYLYQAEGAAYQSIFAEHSSAKATPESCLATAKQDITMVAKYMDRLEAQLKF